jgi:hypothetical protein
VRHFLATVGLPDAEDPLRAAGIDTLAMLSVLTAADLREVGIEDPRRQRRLLRATRALQQWLRDADGEDADGEDASSGGVPSRRGGRGGACELRPPAGGCDEAQVEYERRLQEAEELAFYRELVAEDRMRRLANPDPDAPDELDRDEAFARAVGVAGAVARSPAARPFVETASSGAVLGARRRGSPVEGAPRGGRAEAAVRLAARAAEDNRRRSPKRGGLGATTSYKPGQRIRVRPPRRGVK